MDEEEAHGRLVQALSAPSLVEGLHRGISAALEAKRGPRTEPDKLLDKLSAAIEKRSGRLRPAPSSPGLSALLVWVNLELRIAPEGMRATLESERGAAVLEQGLRTFGDHVVKELVK